jgi:hypothetical protein
MEVMAKKHHKSPNNSEKIIGRAREQDLLKDLMASKKSEFVAVYGLRRVGRCCMIHECPTCSLLVPTTERTEARNAHFPVFFSASSVLSVVIIFLMYNHFRAYRIMQ